MVKQFPFGSREDYLVIWFLVNLPHWKFAPKRKTSSLHPHQFSPKYSDSFTQPKSVLISYNEQNNVFSVINMNKDVTFKLTQSSGLPRVRLSGY